MPLREAERSNDGDAGATAPDVRGWPVRTLMDDRHIGRVRRLLVDASGVPRYLELDLWELEKRALLPIGHARAHPRDRRIRIAGLAADHFRRIPDFVGEPDEVSRTDEAVLLDAYRGVIAGGPADGRLDAAGAPRVRGLDEAGAETLPRIEALSRLPDLHIAEHDDDPRGWDVLAAENARVGRVADLLVDTRAMKVRYLVCAVDEAALELDRQDRRILVPAGLARLLPDRRAVAVHALRPGDIARMPILSGEEVGRELAAELGRAYRHEPADEAFYGTDARFDPHVCFGRSAARTAGGTDSRSSAAPPAES